MILSFKRFDESKAAQDKIITYFDIDPPLNKELKGLRRSVFE